MPEGALRGHPPSSMLLDTELEVNILGLSDISNMSIHEDVHVPGP